MDTITVTQRLAAGAYLLFMCLCSIVLFIPMSLWLLVNLVWPSSGADRGSTSRTTVRSVRA